MDYILDAILLIVDLTNIILCYTQIMRKELCDNKKRIILAYVGVIICSSIYTLSSGKTWSILIEIAIPCIAAVFVINWNIIKTILLLPCTYVLETAVCIMLSYVVAMALDVPQGALADDKVAEIFICSLFSVIMGSKFLYDRKKGIKNDKLGFSKGVYVSVTIAAISFLFIMSAVQAIGTDYKVPYNQTNFLGFLWSIVCIVFFFLFIWLSKTIYKKNVYEKEKDMMNLHMIEQEKYIKLVVEKDMDMRRFRHDVKEHMSIVYKYMEDSAYEEGKEYIRKMYDVFSDSQVIRYIGINAVDAIISEKKRQMDEKGIVFNMKPSICEFPTRLEIYDMCTMFSNIITNGIEACDILEGDDKYVDISVSIYEGRVLISESNKLKRAVAFDEAGNPISTKEDKNKHGFGSKNIRAVVEKYGGELRYHIENDMFTIEIIL